MILNPPLMISARLLPAVEIQSSTRAFGASPKAWLSWDARKGLAYLDGPFGEHVIKDFRPSPRLREDGTDKASRECLHALLDFLGACAESRAYAKRMGKDPMEGENSSLFPAEVGEWAEQMSDEISMLACELEPREEGDE